MATSAPSVRHKRMLAIAAGGLCLFGVLAWRDSRHAGGQDAAPRFQVNAQPAKTAEEIAAAARPSGNTPNGGALAEDPRVALGRKMFFDPNLSVPAGTSCSSCHDPKLAFAGGNRSALGVAHGSHAGRFARRNTPSLLYLRFVRPFQLEWEDEAQLPEAFGGFFWDGRANTVAQVAAQPLLNANEMANPSPRNVANTLRTSAYASELAAEFDHVFDTPEKTVEALGFCLEAFLTSPNLAPFSARFDAYLRGEAQLSPLETEGMALFDDRSKGACSSCHKFDPASHEPERSLFTDYGYDTVSVPRNRALPSNQNANAFDLGVCERHDARLHTDDPWFCGAFRTPSLRNVALRPSYMHNGVFTSLRDVVSFYATRASNPKRWYGSGKFDDLPPKYHEYVNTNAAPYNQNEGDAPALSEHEIDAVVAFLGTLTDEQLPIAGP